MLNLKLDRSLGECKPRPAIHLMAKICLILTLKYAWPSLNFTLKGHQGHSFADFLERSYVTSYLCLIETACLSAAVRPL